MITPEELKQLTNKAIAEGKLRREQKLLAADAKTNAKANNDKRRADQICSKVPEICKKAAANEKNSAIIFQLRYSDYSNGYSSKLEYTQLTGAARIVWNQLVESGLNPTLEYWHDGVGIESGFNMVAHWDI